VRCHVVTGKGGTGKTTVAAALSLALAAEGHTVLLVECEGRQGIAQLFDTPPLPYEERRVAVTRGGGELRALAIDVEEALLEYLEMFYNLRRAGRALRKMGAVDFATTIAPGLRDVLITGKVKEAVTRRENGRLVYDAVVVDAPPTGRITRFLNVTGEMAGLARSGPIKTQSDGVMAVFRSPQTAVHLVTLLEDMPVQETADAIAELTAVGLPVGSVIVNMATEPVLPAAGLARATEGRLTGADLAPGLAAAGLRDDGGLADALAAEAVEHAQRWAAQDALRARVESLGRPTVELPLLAAPIDLGCLFELAGRLEEHLGAEVAA
jgi:anion-transporting  ArsA/GET3 family ATPase